MPIGKVPVAAAATSITRPCTCRVAMADGVELEMICTVTSCEVTGSTEKVTVAALELTLGDDDACQDARPTGRVSLRVPPAPQLSTKVVTPSWPTTAFAIAIPSAGFTPGVALPRSFLQSPFLTCIA